MRESSELLTICSTRLQESQAHVKTETEAELLPCYCMSHRVTLTDDLSG